MGIEGPLPTKLPRLFFIKGNLRPTCFIVQAFNLNILIIVTVHISAEVNFPLLCLDILWSKSRLIVVCSLMNISLLPW